MLVTVLAENAKELRFVYGLLKERGKQTKNQPNEKNKPNQNKKIPKPTKQKKPGNKFLKILIMDPK